MKVSLQLQKEEEKISKPQNQSSLSLLLRTKLPISIFNLPFLSSLSLSSSSLSSPNLSLQTNFLSGPSLKLSYFPNTNLSPLSLSLSSGVSLSGSPNNSPFIISAQFALYPFANTPSPTFSLVFKPSFGDFSIKKSVFSRMKTDPDRLFGSNQSGFVKEPVFSPLDTNPDPKFGSGSDPLGFVPVEGHGLWKDLNLGPTRERALGSGVALWARTGIPVTKNLSVKFRWGVNFPGDIRKGLPFLSIDKIGIERVEEEAGEERMEREKDAGKSVADFEILKGMCVSVGREVSDLRRENREMKRCLDEMIRKHDTGYKTSYSDGVSKISKSMNKPVMVSEDLGEIEGWNKVKKKGISKEVKGNFNGANELESELQRAIMAASASK